MWMHVEALQSNQLEWFSQRRMSNTVSNQGLTGMERIVSGDGINPSTTSDRYTNTESIPVNSPHYSQVTPMHDRGPSMTSTTVVK